MAKKTGSDGRTGGERYVLRLYVAGVTPRSVQAIENVKSVCETHLEGRYELQVIDNRRFAEMLKSPLEEVVGRPLAAFLVVEDQVAVESLLRQARDGRGKGEFALRAGEGQDRNVPVYLSASVFEMEGLPAISVIATDLAEQKRGEQIAAANRAKDHFLATLSHELRTPLTPVLATVQLMERDPSLSADQRELLAVVRRNVEMEARLIDDLLDVTRISRGKVELRQEVVDAHATLRAALEISQGEIAAKRLEVSLASWAGRHHVWADPARLQQVCWNLVKNAVKFTPEGGRVSLRSANDDGGRLRVQITDPGVGIDPQTLPKLFNAFEQGERTTTRRFGGLGLGLTITYIVNVVRNYALDIPGPRGGAVCSVRRV